MIRKLPTSAFEYYFRLGSKRSYAAVAAHYEVAKTTVVELAVAKDWQKRVRDRDQKVAAAVEKRAVETVAAMNEKHLSMLGEIQTKALDALRKRPIKSAAAAIRALALTITQERLVRGEASERVDVAGVIRREFDQMMVPVTEAKDDWADLEHPG